jgi:2,3-bisphosphoglycerate-dependent phosphoglycerate mutase
MCFKKNNREIMRSRLILMRHGQSAWNKKNLFTGWVDIPLSEEGIQESLEGGKKIKDFPLDVVFTSCLIRSQMTVALVLLHHSSAKVALFYPQKGSQMEKWSRMYGDSSKLTIPVYSAPELNERMYGSLQGLDKKETAQKFGAEQVQIWRRSFDGLPPDGESLEMTIKRALPYFLKTIVPHLEKGKNVLVVAHGNSLRGIVMHLDGLSKEEIVKREIATGEQIIYSYDQGRWEKEKSI